MGICAASETVTRQRLAAGAILLALAVSLFFAGKQAVGWFRRAQMPPSEFEAFVAEARSLIPAEARVLVTVPGGARKHTYANYLSTQLHPRIVVHEAPADWVIELPSGEFDRAHSSIRRAGP